MIKALGAAFIFTGAYFIGNYINGAYKKRLEQLIGFRTLISELSLSIRYRPADIPQLLRDAAQKLTAPFCETLSNIADGLSGSDCVRDTWQRAFCANRRKFGFKDDEFEYIAKTGAVFDEIQREKILNGLQAAREVTDAFIEKSEAELKTKGELYKKLSMLGGIALIIITL
jgi:stage III sporulation protein AB